MTWTAVDIPDQTGRVAVVTGANSGLGLEVATRLAEHGATVVLACRNPEKAEAALGSIRAAVPGAAVEAANLDLASMASIASFAAELATRHHRLDLLVNNAGLMAVDRSTTADGFETQFGVNHLGPFALTQRLLPLLTGTPGSRVVTVSSVGHRAGRIRFADLMAEQRYGRWRAYFQSKLANLLFTAELQHRLAASGAATIAVAAHPGFARTDLGREGTSLSNRLTAAVYPFTTQSVRQGALPILRAATDPGVAGGEFYGPRLLVAGSPVQETPSRRARSRTAASQLWDRSADLIAGQEARSGLV